MDPKIESAIEDDGGLAIVVPWLSWTPGDKTATLDGEFTASELRSIADHMDKAAVSNNVEPVEKP